MPRRARTFHEAFAEGWEPGAEACLTCPLPDCVEITHPNCPRYRNKNRPAAARQAVKRDRALTLSRVADKHCRSHA